jgi:hypothetical protein
MAKPTTNKSTRKTRASHKQDSAKTARKSVQKNSNEKPTKTVAAKPEFIKAHWWQRTPRSARPTYPKLPNVLRLTRKTYDLLSMNWKLVSGIALVYGLLNILLVRGLNGGVSVSDLKTQFTDLANGGWGNLGSAITIFGLLVSSSSSGTASDAAGAYQSFLTIITSLAFIWTFRQLLTNKEQKLRVRDSFYRGMYPLIPALLVLLMVAVQLIPVLIGGTVYGLLVANGIATTTPEILISGLFFVAMIVWSLLLITATIFAMCIVTLPDMEPKQALQTARKLVKFRRAVVFRKILFLPVLLLLILTVTVLPTILTIPVLAQWVFFVVSMFAIPISVAYIYTVYRELLND